MAPAEQSEEKPKVKESLSEVAVRALDFAVSRSRGAALVNLAESGLDQEEVVNRLPDYYHHVSVQDILGEKAKVPKEKRALVVTGYSREYYSKREEENTIQSFIRASVRNLSAGVFAVLVLSDSLPDEDIFRNASLPWYNGPFQGDDTVWSIKALPLGSGIELVRHNLKSEIVRTPKIREVKKWEDKQTIQFERF